MTPLVRLIIVSVCLIMTVYANVRLWRARPGEHIGPFFSPLLTLLAVMMGAMAVLLMVYVCSSPVFVQ